MPNKYVTIVEDYNVPLTPWYILLEKVFDEMTDFSVTINSLLIYKKEYVFWSASLDDFEKAGLFFNEKLINEESFSKILYSKEAFYFQEIKKFIDYLLKTNLRKKTNQQLFDIYLKYYNNVADCWRFGMAIQYLDMGRNKYSDRVKEQLQTKLKKIGNPEIVFSKLIIPRQSNMVQLENMGVLKLLAYIQKSPKRVGQIKNCDNFSNLDKGLARRVEELAKKFGWMQFYYVGPPADANYYFDLLKSKLNKNATRQIAGIKLEKKKILDFQKKCLTGFSVVEKNHLKNLRNFLYLKEARKEIQMFRLNFAMHNWFLEVGRRFNWSPLQCRYIIKNEYFDILVKDKNLLSSDILNERYKKCAFYNINHEIKLVTGRAVDLLEKKYVAKLKVDKNSNELRGSVAYPGRVKGVVKIVNSTADLNKFNQGDILVSFSTNPSLVSAMNKAKAIITNTGGVTCHAAIVSRELKIPCIIGTNIATKVLRDGDKVEVDANKGIVRKL